MSVANVGYDLHVTFERLNKKFLPLQYFKCFICRNIIEGYSDSNSSQTFNTVKTILNINAYYSFRN